MKAPPRRVSSVGSSGTPGPPPLSFFSVLLEAVIHLVAAENDAAEAITASLGSANKRYKV